MYTSRSNATSGSRLAGRAWLSLALVTLLLAPHALFAAPRGATSTRHLATAAGGDRDADLGRAGRGGEAKPLGDGGEVGGDPHGCAGVSGAAPRLEPVTVR